jgi:hypothetical protein
MSVRHVEENDIVTTSSATFVDVPDMLLSDLNAGDWSVFFTCTVKPEAGCAIEFRLFHAGVQIGNAKTMKIDVIGAKIEREFHVHSTVSSLINTDDLKVQWRALYGQARIGDRRITAMQ